MPANRTRLSLSVLVAGLLIVVMSSGAMAANAHVVKGPDVSVSGNTLTVTASIAGLGNVSTAFFELTGTAEVFSQCYNRGGKNPAADNKQETVTVDESGTFPVRNGRTNVTFHITPLSTLDCPGNQVVVIESISWDLTLSGEGISVPITGSTS